MKSSDIKTILNQNIDLREKLYAMGFLFTDDIIDESSYPFYGIWDVKEISRFKLLVAPKQKYYLHTYEDYSLILIGHAYNPFSMISKEMTILESLNIALSKDWDEFWREFNELTGVFTLIIIKNSDNSVYVVGDATGMQTTFYTNKNNKAYISSHTNLLGDLLSLDWDPYVKKLVGYRFFGLLGNSLPGDLTQFGDLKRLIPNHYALFSADRDILIKRFYHPVGLKKSNEEIVKESSAILHNNLELIAQKWKKPAISMTGGCDSKTTLACAAGLYEKFSYFSYTSSEAEDVDAEAARNILNNMGLTHTIYKIPDNAASQDIENTARLLRWNTGDIRNSNANDVKKRLFFKDIEDFDVEVKSWVSETGRAYYSKRFNGRKNFGSKPTPRVCTTLYKFFLHNRKLVRQTDSVFKEYLSKYFEQAKENPVPWQEQLFWEFRVPSWNGLVITGEHRYSFDITIPYNNRRLLELLLSAPIDDRINDNIYKAIREHMNADVDRTGIAITNLKHTKKREKAENVYYILHSKIPF